MLSAKYYEAIATTISKHRLPQEFVSELADYLAQDNPKFDRERFLEACNGY